MFREETGEDSIGNDWLVFVHIRRGIEQGSALITTRMAKRPWMTDATMLPMEN